jgi:tetratricopeptide (TPR) repeat protein
LHPSKALSQSRTWSFRCNACAQKEKDPNGASTSKPDDEGDDTADGSGDLQLAFEVADMARIVFERHAGREEVTPEVTTEVHEVLGDIGAEEERFEEAIADYERAIAAVDQSAEADLRWHANLHYKISLPHELMGDVEAAMKHVTTAASQLKYLLKHVRPCVPCGVQRNAVVYIADRCALLLKVDAHQAPCRNRQRSKSLKA